MAGMFLTIHFIDYIILYKEILLVERNLCNFESINFKMTVAAVETTSQVRITLKNCIIYCSYVFF